MLKLVDTLAIKALRKAKGLSQSDLAKMVEVSQQTIDRWERGVSTPTPENLFRLEQLFDSRQQSKLGVRPLVDLPVEILSCDQFEKFVCALLQSQGHPNAHVYGGQGHKQNGIDIESDDDSQIAVQCKRVAYGNFGPQKVANAIKVYEAGGRQDKEKVLAITKYPTPDEYETAKKAGWQIWGTDKLTDMVRQLPRLEQEYLVRTYFSNRPDILRDCLGIAAPSPFLNANEYLKSASNTPLFNSQAHYIGTQGEVLEHIVDDLESGAPVVVLHGAGGIGKTRLLTELAKQSKNNLCFLQDGLTVSQEDVAKLGDSPYTIVIDNAHQHINNLQACLAALRSENIQILVVTRTYPLEKVQEIIYQSYHDVNRVYEIKPLGRKGALELVKDITGGTPLDERLAELARDNTLLLTLGANMIKDKQMLPDKLLNDQTFSDRVGVFFDDYLRQNIDPKIDKALIASLTQLMAVVQPFSNDDTFMELAKTITQKDALSINTAINNLEKFGVLQKRRGEYYITPDLLADYECEQCLASSDYVVRQIISQSSRKYLGNIFQNLCQLDWRTQQKNLAQRALSEIWAGLNQQFLSGNTNQRYEVLTLVQNIAIYQPEASLELAKLAFETTQCDNTQSSPAYTIGQTDIREKALTVLKNIAHIDKYIVTILDFLVTLADQYPDWTNSNGISYPVQILRELATIDVKYKPKWYINTIVDYVLNNCFSRRHSFSPFMILRQVLENYATSYDGRTLYQYTLPSDFLYDTRQKIIKKILTSLNDPDLEVAYCAAVVLGEALRLEVDRDGAENGIELLECLKKTIQDHIIPSVVLVRIYTSILWSSRSDKNEKYASIAQVALKVINMVPRSLDFELALSILDSYGDRTLQSTDYKNHQDSLLIWLSGVASEAIQQYNGRWLELFEHLQSLKNQMRSLNKVSHEYYNYENIFYAICCESQDFSEAIITAIVDNKVQPKTLLYYPLDALARKFQKRDKVDSCIDIVIKSSDIDLKMALLNFACRDEVFLTSEQIVQIFRNTWQTGSNTAIAMCLQSVLYFSQDINSLTMELLDGLQFTPEQTVIARAIIEALTSPHSKMKITDLSSATLERLLVAIINFDTLDRGSLIVLNQLAKTKMFDKIIDVLLDRISESVQRDIWTYQPIPYSHEGHLEHSHNDNTSILSELLDRFVSEKYSNVPVYHLEALVRFLNLDPQCQVDVITQLLARFIPERKTVIKVLCRSLPMATLWDQNTVSQMLQAASLVSSGMIKDVKQWLFSCIYNESSADLRQVGQPSQTSLAILDMTKKIIDQTPLSDRAHQFYKDINAYVQKDIEFQKERDKEYLADDEAD